MAAGALELVADENVPQGSPARPCTFERQRCAELPDLHDRLSSLGLSQEYRAYRDQYMAWRSGGTSGAEGELTTAALVDKRNEFSYWYPSHEAWRWRRTLSFWIAVSFFEGSPFFTISSLMFCYPQWLGQLKQAMTTFGYIAGKANFIVCTYFMCLETINIKVGDVTSVSASPGRAIDEDPFYLNPFRWRIAFSNLEKVGAGRWPFIAAITYFVGVLFFAVGLLAEFSPLAENVANIIKLAVFIIGSILFILGALAECIENDVFKSFKCQIGWWGSLLNLVGGLLFLLGSIYACFDGEAYPSSFSYFIGSVAFAAGSGATIYMWKDEQFGLLFLSALNNLAASKAQPLVIHGVSDKMGRKRFSMRGASFVMVYCVAATLSVYDFLISTAQSSTHMQSDTVRSFNCLLPCILAHLLLMLNSAVVKPPSEKPFRQLYFAGRILALIMIAFSSRNLYHALDYEYSKHEWDHANTLHAVQMNVLVQ